eukprot:TRINITY_DN32007_c0_g1_i1.p2 TRINITY_DN32007_c0_g1~~TRINITY_DN32007_c0_g1_i1.p2  ORF type:complete len:125 (+),score=21.38 TRINITY_DN32007_c0_g1_i1:81-455(+)
MQQRSCWLLLLGSAVVFPDQLSADESCQHGSMPDGTCRAADRTATLAVPERLLEALEMPNLEEEKIPSQAGGILREPPILVRPGGAISAEPTGRFRREVPSRMMLPLPREQLLKIAGQRRRWRR